MSLDPKDLQAIGGLLKNEILALEVRLDEKTEQNNEKLYKSIGSTHKELLTELDRRTRNTIDEVYYKHPTREDVNEILARLEDVESELDTLKGRLAIA